MLYIAAERDLFTALNRCVAEVKSKIVRTTVLLRNAHAVLCKIWEEEVEGIYRPVFTVNGNTFFRTRGRVNVLRRTGF